MVQKIRTSGKMKGFKPKHMTYSERVTVMLARLKSKMTNPATVEKCGCPSCLEALKLYRESEERKNA